MSSTRRHSCNPVRLLVAAAATAVGVLGPASAAAAEPSLSELEADLDDAVAELETAVEEYNGVSAEIADVRDRRDELRLSLPQLRESAEASATELGDVAARMYHEGPLGRLAPLMDGSDGGFADRLTLIDYLGTRQREKTAGLAARVEEWQQLSAAASDLDAELSELSAERESKESKVVEAERALDSTRGFALERGWAAPSGPEAPQPPAADSGAAAAAVGFVHSRLGAPYRWGGTGPGYDCSGLTSAAWEAAGVSLPHSSAAQRSATASVGREQLQPGDLVFYYPDLHHVAMYVGDGKVIHAPAEGQTVSVANVDDMPVVGYGRP